MIAQRNRKELRIKPVIVLGALLSTQAFLSLCSFDVRGAAPESEVRSLRRSSVSSSRVSKSVSASPVLSEESSEASSDAVGDFQKYLRALQSSAGGPPLSTPSSGSSSRFLSHSSGDGGHDVDRHEFKQLMQSYIRNIQSLQQSRAEAQRGLEQAEKEMGEQHAYLIKEAYTHQGLQFNQKEFQFKPKAKTEVTLKPTGAKAFFNRVLKTHETGDRAKAEKAREIFKGLVQTQGRINARVKHLQEDQDLLGQRMHVLLASIARREDQRLLLKELLPELLEDYPEFFRNSSEFKKLLLKYQKMEIAQARIPDRIPARFDADLSCRSSSYAREGHSELLQSLETIRPVLQRLKRESRDQRLDPGLAAGLRMAHDHGSSVFNEVPSVFDDETARISGFEGDQGELGEEREEGSDEIRPGRRADSFLSYSQNSRSVGSGFLPHSLSLPPPPPPPTTTTTTPFLRSRDFGRDLGKRSSSRERSDPRLAVQEEGSGPSSASQEPQISSHARERGPLIQGRLTRERVDEILSKACLGQKSPLEYVDCMLDILQSLRGKSHVDER